MSIIIQTNEKTPPAAPVTPEAGKEVVVSKETNATLSAPEVKTSEQKESTESEPEGTEEVKVGETKEEIEEKTKKKGGFQRRIDKLTHRMTEKEQEVEYWKQQALKSASESRTQDPVVKSPAPTEGKPKPESFDTHTEYVEALTDWKTETKLRERDEKQSKERLDQDQNKIVSSYAERVKTFSEKTADFSEVLSEVDHVPLSPALRDIILTSDNGPQLAYELAKNPEEYERIAKLPPIACAREVGKLEYRLSSSSKTSPEAKETKITKAPAPLDPVGTGGKGSTGKSIYDSAISQKDYEAIRAKERAKKRSG